MRGELNEMRLVTRGFEEMNFLVVFEDFHLG